MDLQQTLKYLEWEMKFMKVGIIITLKMELNHLLTPTDSMDTVVMLVWLEKLYSQEWKS